MLKMAKFVRLVSTFILAVLLTGTYVQTTALNPTIAYAAPAAAAAFNGTAAAQWAVRNVNAPSAPGYTDYTTRGGDCTNFASHALRVGGLKDVGCCSNAQSNTVWWQRDLNWWDANIRRLDRNSYTWTFADRFGTFLVNSGKGYIVQTIYRYSPTPSFFKLGDIVQISSSKSTAGSYHTMIVTGVSSSGIQVTYRNATGYAVQKNTSLQALVGRSPNLYFIHIRIR